MATYITMATFTDQGIRNVKDSPDRLQAFRQMAEKHGVTLKSAWYTMGACDIVTVLDGPEEAVMATLLKLGSLGNVRGQTLRAFTPEETKAMVGKMG